MPTYSVSTVTATLVASTAYTAIELKPVAPGLKVVKWWVELNSVTSGDKNVLVQMCAFTAAVTTLTAVTAANVPKVDYGMNGQNSVTTVGVNATVEGAGTAVANTEQHSLPANSGMTWWEPDAYGWQFPSSVASVRIRLTPGSTLTTTTATCGMTYID